MILDLSIIMTFLFGPGWYSHEPTCMRFIWFPRYMDGRIVCLTKVLFRHGNLTVPYDMDRYVEYCGDVTYYRPSIYDWSCIIVGVGLLALLS